ncbi:MAG: Hsp20/alpha crystallin family protein [Chloroflexi bacterium]|nr:Hsp20/alpha crystallin family protein [Chloroflexota bacterium]
MRVRFIYSPLRAVVGMERGVEQMMNAWWDVCSALPRTPRGVCSPRTDVYETASDLVVKIEVAGTAEDKIEVLLYPDCLVVSGKRDEEDTPPRTVIHKMDIWYGEFRAEVPIPVAIDAERVEASYQNGMISITLPKVAEETPRPTRVSISLPNG